MKLKSILLRAAFITVLFLGIGVGAQAQGIYSTDSNEKKANDTENTQPGESGGFFRAGGPGNDVDADPDGDDIPIGEGILVLSILSGAYTLIKRNRKRKYEN